MRLPQSLPAQIDLTVGDDVSVSDCIMRAVQDAKARPSGARAVAAPARRVQQLVTCPDNCLVDCTTCLAARPNGAARMGPVTAVPKQPESHAAKDGAHDGAVVAVKGMRNGEGQGAGLLPREPRGLGGFAAAVRAASGVVHRAWAAKAAQFDFEVKKMLAR